MKDISIDFGKQLRNLRHSKKMSQEELAFKAGISAAHLGQIERAEKNPTLETVGKLSDALSISLAEMFSFEQSVVQSEEDAIIVKINAQLKAMTSEERNDILRIIRIFRRHTKNSHQNEQES